MNYELIWHGKSFEFEDYDEAVAFAETMTCEEKKYDTALIITRSEDGVKIQGLRWIIFGMYELVNLTI